MRGVGQINGVAIGLVKDRDGQGRVRLGFPWLDDTLLSDWVPVAAPMAGGGRGLFFMPEVGDEVLVAFEHGRFEHPVVVGFMWNGVDRPPTDEPRERMICSKNGHKIRFLDSTPTGGNQGGIVIEDAHGNTISLSNGQIAINAVAVVQINAPTILLNGRPVLPVPTPI
jgi:phage baseplate assembly protein V